MQNGNYSDLKIPSYSFEYTVVAAALTRMQATHTGHMQARGIQNQPKGVFARVDLNCESFVLERADVVHKKKAAKAMAAVVVAADISSSPFRFSQTS